jgi:hypothetical protein
MRPTPSDERREGVSIDKRNNRETEMDKVLRAYNRTTIAVRLQAGTTVHITENGKFHPGHPTADEKGAIDYDFYSVDDGSVCSVCEKIFTDAFYVDDVKIGTFWHEENTEDDVPHFALCHECGIELGIRIVPCDCVTETYPRVF